MTIKPTFTNGKLPHGGVSIVSSRIPPTALSRIQQTNSSADIIVALLNAAENSYSWRQKTSRIWSICPRCQTIFLGYRQNTPKCCSRECNGFYRGQEWARHAHKGRAAWTEVSRASCRTKMTGDKNPAWKGGLTYFKRKGKYADQPIKYVRCPSAFLSMARKDGYVMEHRLLVAQALGRPLTREECVHHLNHDATDNHLANLILFRNNAEHKRHEHGQAITPLWPPSLACPTLA
jgi:hypothetical protein